MINPNNKDNSKVRVGITHGDFNGISYEIIIKTFQDIDKLSRQCRFKNCIHDTEPGCAIKKAVESGQLSRERLDNYKKLLREQKYLNQRRNIYERRKKDRNLAKIYRQGKIIRKYKGND